jgi:hypothetical protein
MRILLTTVLGFAVTGVSASLSTPLIAGGQAKATASHQMPMPARGMMTKDQKMANAMSAAPPSVTARATILDWPTKEGDAPVVLRTGTNGWSCLPDMPETEGNDPMCLDRQWMEWVDAYMTRRTPQLMSVGIGYMIAPGGGWGSNTDPYAMTATSDNQWHQAPPHLMILVPDTKSLAGISTDPKNGGPYVMYAGTPYAHIMAPITGTTMKASSTK